MTRSSYTFGGWYKEAACANAWNFSTDTVTGNITLYAKWTYIGGGGGGGTSTPAGGNTVLTSEQITQSLNDNRPLDLDFTGINLTMAPEALPDLGGGTLKVEASVVTDPNTLNTFFIAYPDQRGIMKGYNITFTRENNGQTANITRLNDEITLTFELSPEELAGIDPSTLIIYKQGDDGNITQLSGEFNWRTNSLSVSTSHLCTFFIMGQKGIPTQRLAGDNRYATSAAISVAGWQSSDNVILVSGEDFPDALAGTTLAGFKDAPVLLTAKDSLSSETLAELKRLKANNIYILGGTSVISKSVEDLLARDYTVTRIFGPSRYETAVKIGQFMIDARNPSTSD